MLFRNSNQQYLISLNQELSFWKDHSFGQNILLSVEMYQFGPSQWERGNRSDSMSKSVWGPWQPCLVNIQFKYCISLDYPLLIQLFYCVSIVSGKLVTINHTLIESFEENYSQSAISFSLEDFYFYFFPVKSNLK